ncbi:hypothetical protein SAY86_024894 [Trapa natans]|uniref:Uncharacterized protein n=1 Tax=Trapa natans TaxID=22666 RepID=A0AAN7M7E8_TRANT|nr:hypothetical protein SAY86_024894 [Trapa natans]
MMKDSDEMSNGGVTTMGSLLGRGIDDPSEPIIGRKPCPHCLEAGNRNCHEYENGHEDCSDGCEAAGKAPSNGGGESGNCSFTHAVINMMGMLIALDSVRPGDRGLGFHLPPHSHRGHLRLHRPPPWKVDREETHLEELYRHRPERLRAQGPGAGRHHHLHRDLHGPRLLHYLPPRQPRHRVPERQHPPDHVAVRVLHASANRDRYPRDPPEPLAEEPLGHLVPLVRRDPHVDHHFQFGASDGTLRRDRIKEVDTGTPDGEDSDDIRAVHLQLRRPRSLPQLACIHERSHPIHQGNHGELLAGHSHVHFPSLNGCEDVWAGGELLDNSESTPELGLRQDRPPGDRVYPHDQVRPRVYPISHPDRTQPPRLHESMQATGCNGHHRLGPAADHTSPGPLSALLQLRAQLHGVPSQRPHRPNPALRLLLQDQLVSHVQGLENHQSVDHRSGGAARCHRDGLLRQAATHYEPQGIRRSILQPPEA